MPTKAAPAPAAAEPDAKAALTGPQRALLRLGLVRPIDLALHLPLRYEDETHVTPIARARPGEKVQVEWVVIKARVEARGRRQLGATITDDSGSKLVRRVLNFSPP